MGVVTSQQIDDFYERYRGAEVAFTRQVMETTGLDPARTFLRLGGSQIPCVIYSSTMEGARVIVSLGPEARERLREAHRSATLRFCFQRPDEPKPVQFFVPTRITSLEPYKGTAGPSALLLLSYGNRPPADLIAVLGEVLEANTTAEKRRDERFVVTQESAPRLGLKDRWGDLLASGTERRGIVQDLSFGGALLVMHAAPELAVGSPASLRLQFKGLGRTVEIPATVARSEQVPHHAELAVVALKFDPEGVPLPYKVRLSQYLQQSSDR